jgi:hypothetical protein
VSRQHGLRAVAQDEVLASAAASRPTAPPPSGPSRRLRRTGRSTLSLGVVPGGETEGLRLES